jgi:hypothetical protein
MFATGLRAGPGLGPTGFIAPMAWIAGAMLVAFAAMDPSEAGRLIEVNLFDAEFLDTRVIAVHNCTRCRSRVPTRNGDRFVNRLAPAVDDLLR